MKNAKHPFYDLDESPDMVEIDNINQRYELEIGSIITF